MRRILCTISAVLAALVTLARPVHANQQPYMPTVGGEVVVQLASSSNLPELEEQYHLQLIDTVRDTSTYELAITDGSSVSAELSRLRSDAMVRTAEPDYVLSAPEASTISLEADPKCLTAHPSYIQEMFQNQWSAPAMGLDSAHAVSTGSGITIAVVDTGVQTDHPDLQAHLVDGFDFVNRDANVEDPPGGVASGHGTFVAGLIVLAAPGAQIMPIRALDPNGRGDEVDVANGIYYAVDHGANIVNLSLGSYAHSAAIDAAVNYALQRGVLVLAAAGNDDRGNPEYPAAIPGVVGIAATDRSDLKASFSNYGRYLSLSGPGTELYSAYDNGAYAFGEGTSFATPLVASVAALVWSAHPDLQPLDVINTVAAGSAHIDRANPAYEGQLGAGRVDAERAVTEPPARPEPNPASVSPPDVLTGPADSPPATSTEPDPAASSDRSPNATPVPTPTSEPTSVPTPDGAESSPTPTS